MLDYFSQGGWQGAPRTGAKEEGTNLAKPKKEDLLQAEGAPGAKSGGRTLLGRVMINPSYSVLLLGRALNKLDRY